MSDTLPSSPAVLAAVAQVGEPAQSEARDLVERSERQIEAIRGEVTQLPVLEQVSAVMPGSDLLFGGAVLIVIMLVHATGVRTVTSRVARHSERLLEQPSMWRADLLMSVSVVMLLLLHVLEIVIWSAALVYSGLVADWRIAGFFAGNTYTTLGYGNVPLARGWEMLAPLIAVSGLFSFGWSGSVLVDLVGRCQRIKDRAAQRP